MDIARMRAGRVSAALRRARAGSVMRRLAVDLDTALRSRSTPPAGAHEVCRALCEEMSARRGGRPVELRFERFPDEIEVTGLWVEFQDFDLVIVEERAEAVQQLVILGHELWHLNAGHRHGVGPAAARALAGGPDWKDALAVAARDGSRQTDEAEADDFGHRLAAAFRPYLTGHGGRASLNGMERSMGYRGRGGTQR
ncbi:toxin-antitoxin system, toxin component family protein [Streptomyces sp. S3(2020)]|uniref:toxin-antitoxin system, toxin component family protein n=1 Tax=Streptomyces sp. S3(2020) TaxID=2732044 RepID=UPI0014881B31|nr:toxin-antitoxin system, toxin component family protein [Streptomyces sp. S3(2020)]